MKKAKARRQKARGAKQRRRLRKTYERWAAAWADLVPRRRRRS